MGVIFLMFGVGLHFNVKDLARPEHRHPWRSSR